MKSPVLSILPLSFNSVSLTTMAKAPAKPNLKVCLPVSYTHLDVYKRQGKEVVARMIHLRSTRRVQAFVKVNCAALPGELLESELFGYEQGAFTGAVRSKPGKFELANKGTIFLDEIAEMSPHLQAKLLHVLQDGQYSRLGARAVVNVDVRVLAATNMDAVSYTHLDVYKRQC